MCDEQHIADNEVLTQILDLQCHLVKYGYYDNQKNVDDVLVPLFELLDGMSDKSSKSGESIFLLLYNCCIISPLPSS